MCFGFDSFRQTTIAIEFSEQLRNYLLIARLLRARHFKKRQRLYFYESP